MHKKLIQDMHYGKINPQEQIALDKALTDKLSDLADTLHTKLHEPQELDELMTTWSEICENSNAQSFEKGFKIGIKIILEIFEKDDELLDQTV